MNGTAKEAIEKTHKSNYYHSLKDKRNIGNILLIGINLNTKTDLYSCIIEEYDNKLNLKSYNKYIPSRSEKKRKNELKSDGIYKKLKSNTRKKINPLKNFFFRITLQ